MSQGERFQLSNWGCKKYRNPILEKEEEYKLINEQLEKKSSDLFDRIDKFSKSHRLRLDSSASTSRSTIFRKTQSLYGGGDSSQPLSDDEEEIYSSQTLTDYDLAILSDEAATVDGGDRRPSLNLFSGASERCSNVLSKKMPGRLQQATESVIKNLQGKLTNQEERMTDLTLQYREKIQENTILEGRIKILEDERQKLYKTVGSLQGTVEKHAKNASTTKGNLTLKESTVGLLKKEIGELKREQRNHSSSTQTFQARLHRALEENQHLKNQNRSLTQQLRDIASESKQKSDALSQRIHELERQKSLLNISLFKQTEIVEKLKKRVRSKNTSGSISGHGADLDDGFSCFSS